MLLQDIANFVADRTGERDGNSPAQITREINNELKRIWYTQDVEGSLAEFDVLPDQQRIVTLPWYVFQVKAVKRTIGAAQRLVTPRSAYMDFHYTQSPAEIRVLGRSPLFKSFVNPGPLTLKLRKPSTESFTVTVRGPDAYGVDNTEDVPFSPTEREHTTTGSYVDITALSKSAATFCDVEARDITNDVVSIIPAGLTEVWCMQCQIFDRNTIAQTYPCNGYTVLFKKWPPYLSNPNDAVIDPLGVLLQHTVTAARLGIRTDDAAMKQANKFEKSGDKILAQTERKSTEGFMQPIDLMVSPWASLYTGIL